MVNTIGYAFSTIIKKERCCLEIHQILYDEAVAAAHQVSVVAYRNECLMQIIDKSTHAKTAERCM